MGVIAPEPKQKKNSSSFFGYLVFILIAVGLPFLIIKGCSSSSAGKTADSTVIEETADLEVPAESETPDAVSETKDNGSVSAADYSNGNVNTSAFTQEAAWYYNQKVSKDKKGLYELTAPVVDAAKILSKSEYEELAAFILQLEKDTGVQIVVLTVNSLGNEDIESYSMKHAEKWRLGQKGIDNGALLTVAMEEHAVRIETGYGTEGVLTDAKCARIIRNVIVPAFRKGDYGQGIISAVKNMAGIITSDESLVTVTEQQMDESDDTSVAEDVIALIFALFIAFNIMLCIFANSFRRRRFGRRGIYMGYPHVHTGKSFTNSGSSFGSGSFGGFSGGGGSFGGGGASGHW